MGTGAAPRPHRHLAPGQAWREEAWRQASQQPWAQPPTPEGSPRGARPPRPGPRPGGRLGQGESLPSPPTGSGPARCKGDGVPQRPREAGRGLRPPPYRRRPSRGEAQGDEIRPPRACGSGGGEARLAFSERNKLAKGGNTRRGRVASRRRMVALGGQAPGRRRVRRGDRRGTYRLTSPQGWQGRAAGQPPGGAWRLNAPRGQGPPLGGVATTVPLHIPITRLGVGAHARGSMLGGAQTLGAPGSSVWIFAAVGEARLARPSSK